MRLFREKKKKSVVKAKSRETPRGNNYMEGYECNLPLKGAINISVYLNIIMECKSRKSRNTWSNRQIWPWSRE